MKKTNFFEIIGVLSLSLILTSAFSISGSVPSMLEVFEGYSRSNIELLISVPSFFMMTMIALSPFLTKLIPERPMIVTGLLLFGIAGVVPVFVKSFPIIFASRIFLGIGTGLINGKAVTIIGERFTGELRQKLQGIRCSMETLGQATLTLVAGQLLVFGWNYSFLIYAAAFLVLFLYLTCVPVGKTGGVKAAKEDGGKGQKKRISIKDWIFILKHAFLGFFMISTNVSLSLRIPSYVIEKGIGTAVDGSTIMSISIFSGFIGGLLFGVLIKWMKQFLLPVSLGFTAVGLGIIVLADSYGMLVLGVAFCGFFVTNCLSYMFNRVPECLPVENIGTANAIVLVGCNLGSFTAPFVLQAVGLISPSLSAGFLAYGIAYAVYAAGTGISGLRTKEL